MPTTRILVNREDGEVRIAFLEDRELVELHTEQTDHLTIVNNIYRGRVQDVVPGLQAAFIDVGLERNMFLHFMDIRPESLVLSEEDQLDAIRDASEEIIPGRIERPGRRPRQDPRAPQAAPPIRRGDDIIVQVMKDEIGGKAPRVTTNLSIAGRYVVMLPFPSQEGGVSRKIALGQDRYRLKRLLSRLKTEDHSFIVRTAGLDKEDEAITKDAETLEETWINILERYRDKNGPGLLYNDHDLIARMVRDAFPSDFEEVVCDRPEDVQEVRRQLEEHLPEMADRVSLFEGTECIFDFYGVEAQIDKAFQPKYWLKSGGYLIVDENEALTAIDVNTGRFTGKRDQEKTSLKTNLEAAEAIARLIRLRDLGGIVVIDFIDMLSRSHQEKVSEEFRRHLRHDRAKAAIGRMGEFGLLVLTRKRQRESLQKQLFEECPYCLGTGYVRQPDQVFRRLKYDVLRALEQTPEAAAVMVSGHPKLLDHLTSKYRIFFEALRETHRVDVVYRADPDYHLEDYQITPVAASPRAALRLGGDRIDQESAVAPLVEEIEVDVMHRLVAEPDGADEEAPEEQEAPPREGSGEAKEGGRSRRRRGRRGRGGRDKQDDRAATAPPTAQAEPETADVEPPAAVVTASAQEPLFVEDEPVDPAAPGVPAAESKKRRTRRGTRGGRGRTKSPAEPLATAPPLRVAVKATPEADALRSLLENIEKEAESAAVPAPKPAPRKAPPEPVPAATPPVDFAALLDQIEQGVTGLEADKPRQTTRPRKTPRKAAGKAPATTAKTPTRKTSATAKKSSTSEEKPAKKRTAKSEVEAKTPARRARKKADEAPAAETPKRTTRRTTQARKKKGTDE